MHPRFYVALAVVVCLAAAGCAGTNVTPGSSLADPSSQAASGLRSTVHRSAAALRVKPDKASFKNAVYVVDDAVNAIKIFSNGKYRELGAITNGIAEPNAVTMDRLGNLYVANTRPASVTEYAPGGTSPSFTYTAGMEYPHGVATDRHGNLYEADQDYVNQYFQGLNAVTQSCPEPSGTLFPTAVAADASGNVFVSYYSISGAGGLFEYIGGLSHCNPTYLSAMGAANTDGLALDANNNLIAGVQATGSADIYVIAPPYTSITRTIGTSGGYFGLSLNRKNKLLFAARYVGGSQVSIYNYQTGALVKVLDASYGLTDPESVVDGPNAVY